VFDYPSALAPQDLGANRGVDDDTAAIQAAIDAVGQAGGGTVILPPGPYLASSLQLRSRVRLLGYGATLNKLGGGPTSILLSLTGTSSVPVIDASVEGLTLVNTGAGGLIYGLYCQRIKLRDCAASGPNEWPAYRFDQSRLIEIASCSARDGARSNVSFGMGVVIAASSSLVNIHDCIFENITENMFTGGVTQSRFTNNTMVRPSDTGFNTHGSGCSGILIANNTIVDSQGHGIAIGHMNCVSADSEIAVVDNQIFNSAGNGISIFSPAGNDPHRRLRIAGNTIRGFGMAGMFMGILARHMDASVITGNIITNPGGNAASSAMSLITVTRSLVSDNHVSDCVKNYGIVATGSSTTSLVFNSQFNNG
jgi:hypothetical protein